MKSIQAKQQTINDVFRNQFFIPDFQRPYSWNEDDCAELFADLTDSFADSLSKSAKDNKYFLGNIIYYVDDKSDENVWKIVDGQQRLTTLLMLMHALYEKTRTGKAYISLKKKIYNVDPATEEAIDGDVRLKSEVPPGEREYSLGDLKKTLALDFSGMSNKNPFKLNYERLGKELDEWWEKNEDKWENFIEYLGKKVVLLPIECESEWDALDLFEIINDRGVQLDDADIFKARIYKAVDTKEKEQFIQRWNDLNKHLDLFRIYMYISKSERSRTEKNLSSKRDELRKYIIKQCLKNTKKPLRTSWKSMMDSLELCHFFKFNIGKWANDADFSATETIYWTILRQHPTKEYWQYPLFVFIHKYAKLEKGKDGIDMSRNKKKEYLELLEETVKFFFTKGVVKNSIDAVRSASLEVCVQIETDDTFLSVYKKGRKENLKELESKLYSSEHGKSYRKGLAFLTSFLNPRQQKNQIVYAEIISGNVHLEHILPQKKWSTENHYDGWKKESHEECVDKLGNLMPLEAATNISSSDSFFRAKQLQYQEKSKVEDAIDLSKKKPTNWLKKDVLNRHDEVVKRLVTFFKS